MEGGETRRRCGRAGLGPSRGGHPGLGLDLFRLQSSQGARQVAGQRRAQVQRFTRDRLREREVLGVQELAPQPVERLRRTPGRRARGARSPAGARGSGGCGPSPAARAAASRPPGPRAISKWVTASRGSSVSVDRRVRTRRSRPSGASIVPVRAGGRPSTSARYSRVTARRRISSDSAKYACSVRASTIRPDVSRSRRCTTPGPRRGRCRPPRARRAPARASPARGRDPGARRRRRACRRPAGARPRRRSRSARGAAPALDAVGGGLDDDPLPRAGRGGAWPRGGRRRSPAPRRCSLTAAARERPTARGQEDVQALAVVLGPATTCRQARGRAPRGCSST